MGIYFNPKNKTITEWLNDHAIAYINIPKWCEKPNGYMLVVKMQGNTKTDIVIGIGYNEKEYNILIEKDDRIKTVYKATIDDLAENPKIKYLLKRS